MIIIFSLFYIIFSVITPSLAPQANKQKKNKCYKQVTRLRVGSQFITIENEANTQVL